MEISRKFCKCIHMVCVNELGCCTIGEHFVDTQGFLPCKIMLNILSYWVETKVNK